MSGSANYNEEFLQKLANVTEANLHTEQFGVSELARALGMSRSSLHRHVHFLLKISPSQYVRQKRLEKGLTLLRQSSMTVSEVAFEVGFGSVSYFIKCFHDYYGYPPGEVGARSDRDQNALQLLAKENSKRKRWLIAAAAVLFMILLLIITKTGFLFPLQKPAQRENHKIIAVLPMHFDGSDSMKRIAEGIRESLINSLMDNENLIVRSTTSVEQYRKSTKPVKQIASELNVNYIIEIRGSQRSMNETMLQVNLADAVKDEYLWGDSYPLNTYEKSLSSLHSHITREIMKFIKEENFFTGNEFLEEPLTHNPAANHFFKWALNILALKNQNETLSNRNKTINDVLEAKYFLTEALKLDSLFEEAYTRLAHVYIDNLYMYTGNERYLDTGLVMVENAFALQDRSVKNTQYSWLQDLRSKYYLYKGDEIKSKAINEEIEKLYNPNDYESFPEKSFKYAAYDDYYLSIYNFYRFQSLKPPNKVIPPAIYRNFSCNLYLSGFPDVAQEYMRQFHNIYNDSLTYYFHLSHGNYCSGQYNDCILNASKALEKDSLCYYAIYWIMTSYVFLNDFNNALRYAYLLEQRNKGDNVPEFIGFTSSRFIGFTFPEVIAFVFQKTGNDQMAAIRFASVKNYCHDQINSHKYEAAKYESHFRLACIYSVAGEKEKALYYLNELSNRATIPYWIIVSMKDCPLLENIRNENEFQILNKVFEKKYLTEHDRIAKLLREEGKSSATVSRQ